MTSALGGLVFAVRAGSHSREHDAIEIDQGTRHRRRAAWVPVELPGLGRWERTSTPRGGGRGRARPYGTEPHRGGYARSDLFERRRRLMDDRAAYLDGQRGSDARRRVADLAPSHEATSGIAPRDAPVDCRVHCSNRLARCRQRSTKHDTISRPLWPESMNSTSQKPGAVHHGPHTWPGAACWRETCGSCQVHLIRHE